MDQLISLHRAAPPKPKPGLPCNGCGVCCAAETCPVGRVVFRSTVGPCPALEWDGANARYHCGLVAHPEHYWTWIPQRGIGWLRRLVKRWVAIGQGCDSDVDIVE